MNHHREGSGEPLVLIHGVGHHWQAWRPIIDRLSGEFDVIACDSPGFGRSAPLPPGIEPTIPAYTDAFARFFAEHDLGHPHVAGNSMGGAIALELARRRVVASVVALSPAGFWSDAERKYCQASLGVTANMPPALRPAVRALAGTAPGRVALFTQLTARPARMPAEAAQAALDAAWAAASFNAALKAFDTYRFHDGDDLRGVPVTIAWGRHDRLLLHRPQARRARAELPWARHLTLGAGHLPFFDDPDAVAETIRSGVAAPP